MSHVKQEAVLDQIPRVMYQRNGKEFGAVERSLRESGGSLGAPWLVRVRWAAVLGQGLVFIAATELLELSLSWAPFLAVSSLIVLSNILLSIPRFRSWLVERRSQGLVLIGDVLLLSSLLYAYGGHTNPFSMVYLVHVVLAALLLGSRWTWGISLLCSLCYAGLFRWYVPVPELSMGHSHGEVTELDLHLQGMLVAFILIAFLISGFLQRMRSEIDWREQELARRRANEEKLAAVTTLSASVAHELGTPLAAMMLVVDDMQAEVSRGDIQGLGREVEVLRGQLERCSDAMVRLGQNSGELFGEMPREFSVNSLVEAIEGRLMRSNLNGRVQMRVGEGAGVACLPIEGVHHIVSALIKNSLEATTADDQVNVVVEGHKDTIEVVVEDSGRGMSEVDLRRIGEPFFTTKDFGRGMGLGLFITKLFTERLGGSFSIRSALGAGTRVGIQLPRVVAWRASS